jgi:hypothetical protein
MKITRWVIAVGLAVFGATISMCAQPAAQNSMFLGQTPPGNKPVVFTLPVAAGSFAAERIAISDDGREIIYQELDGYTDLDGQPHTIRMKRFTYANGQWHGPTVLFEELFCPALAGRGDTLLYQKGIRETYYSVREGAGWSAPRRYLSGLKIAHYDQITDKGTRYIGSVAPNGVGGIDRCLLLIQGADTTVTSLGAPINTSVHDLDFFVARDDSYMLVATPKGLCISYHKPEGGWTNPKNLGPVINFGLNSWGPFVTRDNQYLFYTTGTKSDYSDTHVYWVTIGELIDGLKYTNFAPYVKAKPANQKGSVGKAFSYAIPENAFFDDDGNNTLTITAALAGPTALPSWLRFDAGPRTFSGTPPQAGAYSIAVIATDTAGEKAICTFKLEIE